jgi:hypothetical protein
MTVDLTLAIERYWQLAIVYETQIRIYLNFFNQQSTPASLR